MNDNVKITFVNRTMDTELPKIFLFAKNEIPTFDVLRDSVAWRVIEGASRNGVCVFTIPTETHVDASWNNGACCTTVLPAIAGKRYSIKENAAGIDVYEDSNAANTKTIDVRSAVRIPNGINANLYRGNKLLMVQKSVKYDQTASFVVRPKICWGLASEVK